MSIWALICHYGYMSFDLWVCLGQPSRTGAQIPHRWTPENRSLVMMNGGGGEVTDPYGAVANLPKNPADRTVHSPHKKPHFSFSSSFSTVALPLRSSVFGVI
nr:hypothetical protein CFP56_79681 [Quercus suber]